MVRAGPARDPANPCAGLHGLQSLSGDTAGEVPRPPCNPAGGSNYINPESRWALVPPFTTEEQNEEEQPKQSRERLRAVVNSLRPVARGLGWACRLVNAYGVLERLVSPHENSLDTIEAAKLLLHQLWTLL
ncbi:hypothetical protein GCM10027167_10530 [Nocardia heshunensis]